MLSYFLVGVVPFCILVCILYIRTVQNMEQSIENNFENVFETHLENIQAHVMRIENAVELICTNNIITKVATVSYTDEYSKYMDITKRFDSAMQSLLIMNPELSSYQLYTSNNLVGTRSNFFSIEDLKNTDIYTTLEATYQSQWFYKNDKLYLARKIYNESNLSDFSILAFEVSYQEIFSNLEGTPYEFILREVPITQPALDLDKNNYSTKTSFIMGGAGVFSMYMDKSEANRKNQDTLLIVALLIAASSAALLAIINVFSNIIVRRIERINSYFSRVVKEHFSTTIPIDYYDELGTIIVSVNDMIVETRRNIYDTYKSQLRQREYEIKALQAQINPHFLYNTLSAINWYALQSGDERISNIVTSLAKFYRTALNNGKNITTIQREIENIQSYLDIQLNIHSNSFDVEYQIDSNAADYKMPHLILQPVVENAVEHGIDHKEDGRGKLLIQIFTTEDTITFKIHDNGPGMNDEVLDGLLKNKKSGYGLRNVDKRLKLFFEENYTFTFECIQGTCCHICIPKRLDLEEIEA